MRHTTANNHKTRALNAIDSLFGCAKLCGMTSTEISEAFNEIMGEHSKLPQYLKYYLRGVYDEKWKGLYKDSLLFGGFYNGQFYTTHASHDRYYQKHGITPVQWCEDTHNGVIAIGHYWKTTATYKPFSADLVTNKELNE
jgi:hypothetical protein